MEKYKLFDTSALIPIIHEARCPEILQIITQEGYRILIPKEVYREIKDISIIAELLKNGKIDLCPEVEKSKIENMKNRYPFFHSGEISVLLYWEENEKKGNKGRCIIDEKDARTYAKIKNIKVNGIIGLLLWLKENNKIDKETCISIYEGLKNNPRLPKDLLRDLLK